MSKPVFCRNRISHRDIAISNEPATTKQIIVNSGHEKAPCNTGGVNDYSLTLSLSNRTPCACSTLGFCNAREYCRAQNSFSLLIKCLAVNTTLAPWLGPASRLADCFPAIDALTQRLAAFSRTSKLYIHSPSPQLLSDVLPPISVVHFLFLYIFILCSP